jgi:hypothetical protein
MSPDLLTTIAPRAAPPAAQPNAASQVATVPAAGARDPAPPVPNPRLRIDPALSLVVLEFRDSVGEVAQSIPSARELAAYREQGGTEPNALSGLDVTR